MYVDNLPSVWEWYKVLRHHHAFSVLESIYYALYLSGWMY